ncbi:MAG: molecular chaperone [Hyphomonadaceae bacterium]
MARAIFLVLVLPLLAGPPAAAQSGGIQVAPVLVAMSTERSIATVRVRNGREHAVAFEIDAYIWTQDVEGLDVLTPTNELLVAPGIFEAPASGEQIIRLGVRAPARDGGERAYRLLLRELPRPRGSGATLGFALEMSLPVFVTPVGASARLETELRGADGATTLELINAGDAHVQVSAVLDSTGQAIPAPRYLLAGARSTLAIPAGAETVRIRFSEGGGVQAERVVHVSPQAQRAVQR